MNINYSLGLIEVKALGNAIIILDDMLKAGEVEFVATERKRGGWLVSIVVRGDLSSVRAAVAAGVERAKQLDCLKVHEVIARPHPEILKFLHLDDEEEKTVNSEIAGTHVGAVGKGAQPVENGGEVQTEESKPADEPQQETAPPKRRVRRGRPKKTEENNN